MGRNDYDLEGDHTKIRYLYMGECIYRNIDNGMYYSYTDNGLRQADTFDGIKKLIKEDKKNVKDN